MDSPLMKPRASAVRESDTAQDSAKRVTGGLLVPGIVTGVGADAPVLNYYWCGALPGCPVESLDVAGVNFPKVTEELALEPGQRHKYRRIPRIGAIVMLDKSRIDRLVQMLPRKVLRFFAEAEQKAAVEAAEREETAGGRVVRLGDVVARPRKGKPITIPSPEEREALEKQGRWRPYTASPLDEPAARYLFMVRCRDQKRGERGDYYPEPLEVTGLEYPVPVE